MFPLYDETDYRVLLKRFYQMRKEAMPLYSYRMMGQRLGLDASQLFRILQGEQHLPPRCVPLAKDLLELKGRGAQYFDILVAASRTRSQPKRIELLDQAFALRDVERKSLDQRELQFLSQWWIPAVRAYLEVCGGKANAKQICKSMVPSITMEQAEEALGVLKDLGLVKKMASGRLALAQSHLTVGGPEKSQAVRHFQRQALGLSAHALDAFEPAARDISTLTIAVDQDGFSDIREMAREFRRQVQKRVEECAKPDRVMQLTMALYPVVPSEAEAL